MLSRKTVFVVGAGASRELGLPIGEGLKPKIVEAIQLDRATAGRTFKNRSVDEAVMSYVHDERHDEKPEMLERFVQAATAIQKALPFALSIDQYLDSQRHNPTIVKLGKIGIAAAILNAERESAIGEKLHGELRFQGAGALTKEASESWHKKLVQLLTANVPKSAIANVFDDVAFIVFNYDRCIEHYLAFAISRYYDATEAEFHSAIRRLKIIHAYGQVGNLPWQHGPVKVAFGGQGEGQVRRLADELLTFTEAAQEGVSEEIKALIADAETVVFMGFGYLPQNVELLHPHRMTSARRVFYTTCGISARDAKLVVEDLHGMFNPLYEISFDEPDYELYEETGRCSDLMQNNWMMLSR